MIAPMAAQKADAVPEGDENIVMELKYDGWRALLDKRGEAPATLHTGKEKPSLNENVPYITDALSHLLPDSTLDGEIVDLAGEAARQWNRTQKVLSRKSIHAPTPEDPMLTYVLFDILELNGKSLLGLPLTQRRQLLEALMGMMPSDAPVQISPQFPCTDEGFNKVCEAGWEGVVCKRLDAPYAPGARNGAWLKIKPEQEVDVVCTGTFPPKPGSRHEGSAVGGFTFEVTHNEGTLLNRKVTGKCGTGMDDVLREDLLKNEAHYVGKVAVVGHGGIAPKTGALRFPSLIRFRDPADKSAEDVRGVLNDESSTKIELLDRALSAEERADELQERVDDLEARLSGAVKKAVSRGGPRGTTGKRNYNSMLNPKLSLAIQSLRAGEGDAYEWVTSRNGDPVSELSRAEGIARGRGMTI